MQLLPPKIIGIIVDDITVGSLTADGLTKWLVILGVAGILMYIARYYWRVMIFGSAVFYPERCVKNYSIILQECRHLSTKKDV